MKRARILSSAAVWLASLGMMIPNHALAADPAARQQTNSPVAAFGAAPAISDVALGRGGLLTGQVTDPQGIPVANAPVSLRQHDRELANGLTDAGGRFAFRGLHGGTYGIVGGQGVGVFRAWAADTAPPAAQEGALVVSGGEFARGQTGGVMYWLTNPWVIAGLVATAIAVPIAVNNRDKDNKS